MDEAPKIEAVQSAIDAVGGKQEILAERLGCAQQTVSKLLRGEIPMTADWALRLDAASGIPAPTFYPALAAMTAPAPAGA